MDVKYKQIDLLFWRSWYHILNKFLEKFKNKKINLITPYLNCFNTTYSLFKNIDNIYFLEAYYDYNDNKYKYNFEYIKNLLDYFVQNSNWDEVFVFSLLDYFWTNNEELDKIISEIYKYRKKINLIIILDVVVSWENYKTLETFKKWKIDFLINWKRKFFKSYLHWNLIFKDIYEKEIKNILKTNKININKKINKVEKYKNYFDQIINTIDIIDDEFLKELKNNTNYKKKDKYLLFYILYSINFLLPKILKYNLKHFKFLEKLDLKEIKEWKVKINKRMLNSIFKNFELLKNDISSISKIFSSLIYIFDFFNVYTIEELEYLLKKLIEKRILSIKTNDEIEELKYWFNILEKNYYLVKNSEISKFTSFDRQYIDYLEKIKLKKYWIKFLLPKNKKHFNWIYFFNTNISKQQNISENKFKNKIISKEEFKKLSDERVKKLLEKLNISEFKKSVMWRTNYKDILSYIKDKEKIEWKKISINEKNKLLLNSINSINWFLILYK